MRPEVTAGSAAGAPMTADVVRIPASVRSLAVVALITNAVIAHGLYRMIGLGTTHSAIVGAAVGISVLGLLFQARGGAQRLEIHAGGFTNYNAFGRPAQAHRWEEIEGHFAVIQIGPNEAVAYNLVAARQAGKRPNTLLSGYDEAIPCLFALSAPQIALLLNNHKKGMPTVPAGLGAGGPA